jgi:hypothetical protein
LLKGVLVKPTGIKADGLGAMGMDPVSDPILDLVSGLDMDQELDLEPGVDMESGLDLDLGMDLEAGLSLDPVFELDPDLNMDLDTDINTVLVLLVFSLMSSASLPLESPSVALILSSVASLKFPKRISSFCRWPLRRVQTSVLVSQFLIRSC